MWTAHIPITGTNTRHHAKNPQPHGLFNTVPQNLAKCNITLTRLKKDQFPNIIDSTARIEDNVNLGYGNIIYPFSIICSDTKIENFCVFTHGTIIAHKVKINSFTTVGSRTSILGNSKIGKEVFIGANVLIGENINVGDYSRVIMGTQLLKNLKTKEVAFGNPAKIFKI